MHTMKSAKILVLLLFYSSLLSYTSLMAAETATDFIRSPASLQYFVQESSFVGTGYIVTEAPVKGEKAISISGTVVIQRVLIPSVFNSPASIPFERKISIAPFVSDPIWGNLVPEKMNGTKVVAFASGASPKLQLIGLIRLENVPANFIEDLTSIFQKKSFSASDITQETLIAHPVLTSYALRTVFSQPGNWDVKLKLAKNAFATNNPPLSESGFHEAMLSLRKCVKEDPEAGTQFLQLALQDLQSSNGQVLSAKLAVLESTGAESISQRADWAKATLAVLTQKEGAVSNSPQELRVIRRVKERLAGKN
jgi:hypothetical protein